MANPVSQNVFAAFKALVGGTVNGLTSSALFAGGTADVYEPGEVLDRTKPITAAIGYVSDDADNLETTEKLRRNTILMVMVEFDGSSDPSYTHGSSVVTAHHNALTDIIDAIHASRDISGNAIDAVYVGGGLVLEPVTIDNQPARWSFAARFRVDFRHLVGDGRTQV